MKQRKQDKMSYIVRKYIKSVIFNTPDREKRSFNLAEKLTKILAPQYIFSEHFMYWREDQEFLNKYRSMCKNDQSADRKFFMRSLLQLTEAVPGDTVKCGTYEGCSSYFTCQKIQGSGRQHHIFDSWEGLSPTERWTGNIGSLEH